MIRFSKISILLLPFIISCSIPLKENLRTVESSQLIVKNLYFSDFEKDYIYKANIEAYGKFFGGVLIVKKVATNTHRIVMTTEFGSKLIDLEYKDGVFTKNFILEELDRKVIINELQDDIRLILTEELNVKNAYETEQHHVFLIAEANKQSYYFLSKESNLIEKVVCTSKRKEKKSIEFFSNTAEMADSIFIKHQNIKLQIEFRGLKNE